MTLEWLGQNQPFIEATKTEFGMELLKDWLNDMERLLVKIIEETASPEEKAEFRVLKRIVNGVIIPRINKYNAINRKLKQETANE